MTVRTVLLHGPLAEKYGKEPLVFSADTVHQLMKALEVFCKGFKQEIRKYSHFAIVKEKDKVLNCIKPEEYVIGFGSADKIHLVADVTAAGAETFALSIASSGTLAYYAAYAIYTVALMYVMGQVIQGMQDTITTEKGKPDNKSSLFNGPENRSMQGARVQLNYGIFRVGSVTVNQIMTSERQAIAKTDYISMYVLSTGTVSIFANDTYLTTPLVTNFIVNGATTAAGGTYSGIAGVTISVTAAGLVTVVESAGTSRDISISITATDGAQNIDQIVNVRVSPKPPENHGGVGPGGRGNGGGGGGDSGGDM